MNKISVYGAGGTGINLTRQLELGIRNWWEGSDPSFYRVDTSKASGQEASSDNTHIFPNTDGSGKDRSANADQINNEIREVLAKFEPQQFNVVVFSASGGSGSVIGPAVIREIQKQGKNAVAVVLGSFEDKRAAMNTKFTLATLDRIAQITKTPVIMSYHSNTNGRTLADKEMSSALSIIMMLLSGVTEKPDAADLSNWLNYTKVTDVPAYLNILTIAQTDEQFGQIKYPISVLNMMKDPGQAVPAFSADYEVTGYFPGDREVSGNVHAIIDTNGVEDLVGSVEEVVKKFQARAESRPNRRPLSSAEISPDDDGMILG